MVKLFQRKDKKYWQLQCTINSKRRRISTQTTNKKLAEERIHELMARLREEDADSTESININTFKKKYFEYSKTFKSNGTYINEAGMINRFFDWVAKKEKNKNIVLSDISSNHVEQFVNYLKANKTMPKTINNYIAQFKAMFNQAIKWNHLSANPCKYIKMLPYKRKRMARYLTRVELKAVINASSDHVKQIITFLAYTGIRISELIHLHWDDIDFTNDILKIQSKPDWTPKDYEARTIPLHADLVKLLKKLKKNSKSEFVFTSPLGKKIDKDNLLKRHLKKYAKKAGVKNVTWHVFRHTFASHFLMSGGDLVTLKCLLGHSDIKTTMIYSHLASSHIQKAVNRIKLI